MAKTGFEYTVVAKLTAGSDTAGSACAYTAGQYLGPASTFNITPTANDVKDYGDDRTVETDTTVTGGTTSIELNEKTADIYCLLLGHTNTDGEVLSNADDIAPYVGLGAIGKSKRNGSLVYTAKWYYKTQFKEPNDENATKQESTSFTHTTLEGNLFTCENGDWKAEKEFDTLAAAKSWLNGKANISGATGSTS